MTLSPGQITPALHQRLLSLTSAYHPPLLCRSVLLSMCVGVYKQPTGTDINYTRVPLNLEGGGSIGAFYLDIADSGNPDKAILLVPGVTGDSSDNYVKDLTGAAVARGYNVVVANMHVHKKESGDNLKLVDVCDHQNNHQIME